MFDLFIHDKEKIPKFLREMLNNTRIWDDYKEFLELCIIFLSESPSKELNCWQLGAIQHTWEMSIVLYFLKIFLFWKDFKLTPAVEAALSMITIFIVHY